MTKKNITKINSGAKVQNFLNSIPFNFEKNGETLKSPIFVLKENKAHCLEGALLAKYIFDLHKIKSFLVDLKVKKNVEDFDHVICVFKKGPYLGAVSKTNHTVLRYREPIYKNLRELVMSYFHEYFLDSGEKTLRSYSKPFYLNKYKNWQDSNDDLWKIGYDLDKIKHYDILPKNFVKLRKADKIEIEAGKLCDYTDL